MGGSPALEVQMSTDPEPSENDITKHERAILTQGVRSWQGPGYRPHLICRLLGVDRQRLRDLARDLSARLSSGAALRPDEWVTALLMTEVGFASRVAGMGSQWVTATGRTDSETIDALRQLQRKLATTIRDSGWNDTTHSALAAPP